MNKLLEGTDTGAKLHSFIHSGQESVLLHPRVAPIEQLSSRRTVEGICLRHGTE
jgi:hypothetical protein